MFPYELKTERWEGYVSESEGQLHLTGKGKNVYFQNKHKKELQKKCLIISPNDMWNLLVAWPYLPFL